MKELNKTPDVIVIPDDVLADIYQEEDANLEDIAKDYEADYWIDMQKSGLI